MDNHLKRIGDIGKLKKEIAGRKVIIAGSGKDGKTLHDRLRKLGIGIVCFVDDDTNRQLENYYNGTDCLSPNKCVEYEECVLLICIGAFTFLTDEGVLEQPIVKHFDSKVEIILFDRYIYLYDYIMSVFKNNNVDIYAKELVLGGVRFPNYLLMSENIKRTFIEEAADLILPDLFFDYSVIDEGPYACQRIKQGNFNVVDCGANLGIFSAIAASYGNRVYAFEPIEQCQEILKCLVELYDNIKVVPYALSDKAGEVRMLNTDNIGQNKISDSCDNEDAQVVTVKSTTLDSYVDNERITIDFIKADIEGAERSMLRGADLTLKRFAPDISICTYHLDDDPEVLANIIKTANSEYYVKQFEKKLFASVK